MDCSGDLSSSTQNICYQQVLWGFIFINQRTSSAQLLPLYHLRKLGLRDQAILPRTHKQLASCDSGFQAPIYDSKVHSLSTRDDYLFNVYLTLNCGECLHFFLFVQGDVLFVYFDYVTYKIFPKELKTGWPSCISLLRRSS